VIYRGGAKKKAESFYLGTANNIYVMTKKAQRGELNG